MPKILNISCNYLHYLQSYDHLNICIIIYWNILEYIGIYSGLARIVKKIFSAERVKSTYNYNNIIKILAQVNPL